MQAKQRKHATWGDLIVGLIIFLVAAMLAVFLFPRPEQALIARVMVDGEIILSCRLDELEEPMQLPIEGEYCLTLELSADGVRVLETQCPGEDCLHMGLISHAGEQIVCLPNRVVVSLQGESAAYDAVTG